MLFILDIKKTATGYPVAARQNFCQNQQGGALIIIIPMIFSISFIIVQKSSRCLHGVKNYHLYKETVFAKVAFLSQSYLSEKIDNN